MSNTYRSCVRSAQLVAMAAIGAQATKYKFGVISDIHLQPNYLPDRSPENYCYIPDKGEDIIMPNLAYFGRMHCDAPFRMVQVAMEKLAHQDPDLDFILVPGDLIGHSITIDPVKESDLTDLEVAERYHQLMVTHSQVTGLFEQYFGDIPVLPAFGNNDQKYHYQTAVEANRILFYQQIYQMWFEQHHANKYLPNLDEIKQDFIQGGWYRVPLIPNKLTLLSFNSLQFNDREHDVLTQQIISELDWFEEQLTNAGADEKFIIQMHIYETADWWQRPMVNWTENGNQERFLSLMEEHREKFLLEVTGHDHLSDLRYQEVFNSPGEYYLNKVIFPGLTASSNTEPGFGTFVYDSEDATVSELKFTFIDLEDTIDKPEETPFDELKWFNVDFNDFGLEDLSGASMHKLVRKLFADSDLAREFQFNRMGVNTTNTAQVEYALQQYKDLGVISMDSTPDDAFLYPEDFIITACIMSESTYKSELDKCTQALELQKSIDKMRSQGDRTE